MSKQPDLPIPNSNERDREIFFDAIAGREFTLADVIGQAGGDFLKGESPVPRLVQIKTELKLFIGEHLQDSSGALQAVLKQLVDQADEPISHHLDQPLLALQELITPILEKPTELYELVHQVDFKWGQMYEERPYFQQPGSPAHPDDEYTHESVKAQLTQFLANINANLEKM
ncbi:MAG: hypothetical protein VKJ02_04890 [Snowella sp.]|nr:hypothetical protein [Snowella sp.]